VKSGLWKRLPLLLFVGLGIFLWRGGFGLLPVDRTVVFRLPAPYGQLRELELEIWEGKELLKQSQLLLPNGLTAEPQMTVPLSRGPHRAVARWKVSGQDAPQVWTRDFDPGTAETVVLSDGT